MDVIKKKDATYNEKMAYRGNSSRESDSPTFWSPKKMKNQMAQDLVAECTSMLADSPNAGLSSVTKVEPT